MTERKDITHPEMDLKTAEGILRVIVETDDHAVRAEADLTRLHGYTTEQIRMAHKIVVTSCMDQYGGVPIGSVSGSVMHKGAPQGHLLEVNLLKDGVQMKLLNDDDTYVLVNEFPFSEPEGQYERERARFADYRQKPPRITSLADLGDDPQKEKLRHMTTGMRWMDDNLLGWNTHVVSLPEHLGRFKPAIKSPKTK